MKKLLILQEPTRMQKLSAPSSPPASAPLPAAGAAVGAVAEEPVKLTASPFAIDHEGEARAAFLKSLRDDALELDEEVIVHRLRGEPDAGDVKADLARCLRVAASHLEIRGAD